MTLPVVSFQVTCRAPATRMGWLAKLAPGQEWLVYRFQVAMKVKPLAQRANVVAMFDSLAN